MMNNILYLSDEKCSTLKTNIKDVVEKIENNETSEWLNDFFQEDNKTLYISSNISFEDFELDISSENPSDTDFENAKRIYEHIKITESQALDERLWTGLTFSKFYKYMKYRYNPTERNVSNKWLFQGYATHSDAFRHGLSMLWWYVYITYDKSKENPYELTEFAFNHKDIIISFTFEGDPKKNKYKFPIKLSSNSPSFEEQQKEFLDNFKSPPVENLEYFSLFNPKRKNFTL